VFDEAIAYFDQAIAPDPYDMDFIAAKDCAPHSLVKKEAEHKKRCRRSRLKRALCHRTTKITTQKCVVRWQSEERAATPLFVCLFYRHSIL
jgi:hypothetical protein